ncbi:MAG: alpha-L-fucosidase [Clostridia bacterium]|nr:alpha-L-fucosidase [Clostridia bacterium]
MNNAEWFRQAKFGMMMHWGLYSLLGGEYRGENGKAAYAEWIQSQFRIPIKEYEQLARCFNPIYFDVDEYIKLAKECGMEYFVLVTKHHDGFAMFRSEVDSFNICEASPFGRDVTEELANACARHGLKFGIYYSQDLDWHEYHGGGYLSRHMPCAGVSWDNSWDFPEVEGKDFNICFENKILPQVEELMRNYGDICLAWFDVPMTINKEQSVRLRDLVKRYQPECLINSRIGNGLYDYVSLGDNEIPEGEGPIQDMKIDADIDYNYINGLKPCPLGLYETAGTMNDSWGYSAKDRNWKSAEMILEQKERLNSRGVNYLLNVGPDGLGRIPADAKGILEDVAKKSE